MGIFTKKTNRSKEHRIWVCEQLQFIGKLSAEEQQEFLADRAKAILDLKAFRLELEALEHSFNRQSSELEKLRAAASGDDSRELLEMAVDELTSLRNKKSEGDNRLKMFDDVMSLFNSGRSIQMTQRSYGVEDLIRNHLNKR